jgi:hypothetical protein
MSATEEQVKHTPGPWYFDERTCYVRTDDVLVCGAYNPGDNAHIKDAERSANGRLMAAAPTMYGQLDTGKNSLQLALEAIATGRYEEASAYIHGVMAGNQLAMNLADNGL